MSAPAKCPDCDGEMFIGSAAPRDGGTTSLLSEPMTEMGQARVGVCRACDELWRQNVISNSWVQIVRVGTRHP